MKIRFAALAGAVVMFFLGMFIGRTQLLTGSVIIKPQQTESMGLRPLEAEMSKAQERDSKVNINTADLRELMGLPGIGEALAERIIEYREKNGDFQTLEEIMAVSGIGEGKFGGIKDYIKLN